MLSQSNKRKKGILQALKGGEAQIPAGLACPGLSWCVLWCLVSDLVLGLSKDNLFFLRFC